MFNQLKRGVQTLRRYVTGKRLRTPPRQSGAAPVILTRGQHNISRRDISPYALKVLYRLHQQGYEAYLVGGGVRDLLLEGKPKDFDIATDASPENVRKLFHNCRLIGRRFRLAHVHFGAHIVEVATFRRAVAEAVSAQSEAGMILRDNCYGTLEEDAWRRDFSINALYYNIADFTVVDHVGGVADLRARCVRVIGDPETRYREDPVRMLRAIRFAAKLNFSMHPKTAAPIQTLGILLRSVPSARLFEECLKLFFSGMAVPIYDLLTEYALFPLLFEQTANTLSNPEYPTAQAWIRRVFQSTDERIAEDKSSTPVFLYAALLWVPLQIKIKHYQGLGCRGLSAYVQGMEDVLHQTKDLVPPPKRMVQSIKDIWILQPRFQVLQLRKVNRLMTHPRFRAAYDFLLLRAEVDEPGTKSLGTWWKQYVEGNEAERTVLLAQAEAIQPNQAVPGGSPGKKRRFGTRRRRKPGVQQTVGSPDLGGSE